MPTWGKAGRVSFIIGAMAQGPSGLPSAAGDFGAALGGPAVAVMDSMVVRIAAIVRAMGIA